MMSRISKLLQRVWSFFMHMLGPTDDWKHILDDADREYQRGNPNFFAVALISEAYEEWVHERIIKMLFLPDIPKPEWLKFEHVINHDTSYEVLQFAVYILDVRISLNYTPEHENLRKFKALLIARTEQQNMRAA